MASTTTGSLFFINHSIFPSLSQSPILHYNTPPGYPIFPTKLSSLERNSIRICLKALFQFVISLIQTVKDFRGLRGEVIQFILSSVNLSFVILEDRDPDELLALEVLSFYQVLLNSIVGKKEVLAQELKGFEEVIATKLKELINTVQKDKHLCDEIRSVVLAEKEDLEKMSKKTVLMKTVVEYCIIYLHNYGDPVSPELLKSIGY